MYVIRYNNYTNRYYSYDTEKYDMSTPMFDKDLHNNDVDFERPLSKLKCQYCGTYFDSRDDLFYHLGFMNIDIGRSPRQRRRKYRRNQRFLVKRKRNSHYYVIKADPIDEIQNLMQKKLKL